MHATCIATSSDVHHSSSVLHCFGLTDCISGITMGEWAKLCFCCVILWAIWHSLHVVQVQQWLWSAPVCMSLQVSLWDSWTHKLLSRSMPYWRMSGHRCASHLLAKLMIIHVTILSSSFFHAGGIHEAWQCHVILKILSGQVQHKTSELKIGAAVRMVKYLKALHAASPWHPCTEWWLPITWCLSCINRLTNTRSTASSIISFSHCCCFQ